MAGRSNPLTAAALVACAALACGDPAPKPDPPITTSVDAATDAQAGDVASLLDLGTADTSPAKLSCPGGAGCPCTSNGECETGVCADEANSSSGKACAFPFGAGCAPGFVTFTAVVGEGATVCVPAAPKLCNPCEKDEQCQASGGSGALCVDQGASGRFCGIACPAAGCPMGYACLDATGSSGAKAKQCQRSEQTPPLCLCSPAAVAAQLSTPCLVKNATGACGGVRACGAGGLSACSGKVPTPESCNGQDDDCNGQTDEGPLCDDGDGCTVGDACVAGTCKPGVAKVCEDGDPCTTGEQCASGSCTVGKPVVCEGGACAIGSCDKTSGKCLFANKPDGSPCDDGNACTVGDACTGAVCLGQPKVCDDKDACTLDSCLLSGDCTAVAAGDGKACDDGQACTAGESCKGGACQGGSKAAPCGCVTNGDCVDDGVVCNGVPYCDKSAAVWACKVNPATVVVCSAATAQCKAAVCKEPAGTCAEVALPDGSTCSDGVALTVGDACEAGACKGVGVQLCKSNADCAKYEDGDLCNGTLFCNKAIGSCQLNPATVVYCPTADDTPCRKNLCAAKTGTCALTAQNELKACEDGNLCTTGEACVQGDCKPSTSGGNTCTCAKDSDCGAFEDGDACNGKLFCSLGKQKCEVNPKTVVFCPNGGDGPCAVNGCDKASGKCAMQATAGKVACDADGNPCTPVDLCSNGKCVADTANVCACQIDADCIDDSDKCNGVPYCDKASNVCVANPKTVVVCDTAGDTACVVTHCQPGTGKCVKGNSTAPCSDGDACTVGDVCLAGTCKPGSDTCGACKGNGDCDDKDACTDDVCGGKPTACSHTFNTAACNDGQACTTSDVCAAGKCAGKPQVCDDQEPCTSDGCQGGTCVFLAANTATCTDGDACTVGDFCLNKNCKAGQAKVDCDDKVGCTLDSCDVFKGCQHAAGVCDDKTVCSDDVCDLKKGCLFTAKPACNDSNGCTADSCDAVKGCVYLPTTATCTDGNACTVGDVCGGAGSCLPGAVTACDDGSVCTADGCDPSKGCAAVNLADGATCSDGNACTEGDLCAAGVCKIGPAKSCPNGVKCIPSYGSCGCPDGTEVVEVSMTVGKKSVCSYLWPLWGYLAVSRPQTEFTISGDKATVTDSKTGLVWQRDPPTSAGPQGDGRYDLAGAVKYCDDLVLAGLDDWRLPSLVELRSIVDRGTLNPAANVAVFPTPTANSIYYWTRTPHQLSPASSAWSFFINDGHTNYAGTASSYRVRCVR